MEQIVHEDRPKRSRSRIRPSRREGVSENFIGVPPFSGPHVTTHPTVGVSFWLPSTKRLGSWAKNWSSQRFQSPLQFSSVWCLCFFPAGGGVPFKVLSRISSRFVCFVFWGPV